MQLGNTVTALLDVLACPVCHGTLTLSGGPLDPRLHCSSCGLEYGFHLDIPLLLAPQGGKRDDEELSHKAQQVAYFDQEPLDDFGVIRPRGAPALYRWLLEDKFRRSVIGLEQLLPTATALTVCGGSGIDAEFLARAGAHVILSDISLGVALQARERARRFGLDITPIVADAEALPFRDASIDVVYVHDGLHHLERPERGLVEMTRVARRALSISEPAAAAVTAAAVRIRLAEQQEEAGNRVRRLTLDEIIRVLLERGFRPVAPHRYAMYYRHWPGRPMRVLSSPVMLPIARGAMKIVNRTIGRIGNKLTVQAVRRSG
jgi:SAM-dependent methyltransferase